MGRLLRLHKTPSPLHAVEETIAALHEELEFTLNFAHSMVLDENYHSAAEVIEEQRRSLANASEKIERALREPERDRAKFRMRVALAGVAATLALASGAFAAFGPSGPKPVQQVRLEAIQEANEALAKANQASDPAQLQALVVSAQDSLLVAAQVGSTDDPTVRRHLLESVAKLQTVIRRNPQLPSQVRERAQDVADTVQQVVVPEVPEEQPSEPEAPAPDASV